MLDAYQRDLRRRYPNRPQLQEDLMDIILTDLKGQEPIIQLQERIEQEQETMDP